MSYDSEEESDPATDPIESGVRVSSLAPQFSEVRKLTECAEFSDSLCNYIAAVFEAGENFSMRIRRRLRPVFRECPYVSLSGLLQTVVVDPMLRDGVLLATR